METSPGMLRRTAVKTSPSGPSALGILSEADGSELTLGASGLPRDRQGPARIRLWRVALVQTFGRPPQAARSPVIHSPEECRCFQNIITYIFELKSTTRIFPFFNTKL